MEKFFLKKIAFCFFLFCYAFASYAQQTWETSWDRALEKAEKSNKQILLLAGTKYGIDYSLKNADVFKDKDFKDFARDYLILLKVETRWEKKSEKYLIVSKANEALEGKIYMYSSEIQLYDPKTSKWQGIYLYKNSVGRSTSSRSEYKASEMILAEVKKFAGVESIITGWDEDYETTIESAKKSKKLVYLHFNYATGYYGNFDSLVANGDFKRYADKNLEKVLVKHNTSSSRNATSEKFYDVHNKLISQVNPDKYTYFMPAIIDPVKELVQVLPPNMPQEQLVRNIEAFKNNKKCISTQGNDWYLDFEFALNKAAAEKKPLLVVFSKTAHFMQREIFSGNAWVRYASTNLVCAAVMPPPSIFDVSKETALYEEIKNEFGVGNSSYGGYSVFIMNPKNKNCVEIEKSEDAIQLASRVRAAVEGFEK